MKNNVMDALSWLPADTETVIGSEGPFDISDLAASSDGDNDREPTLPELEKQARNLPLGLFGLKNGHLAESLKSYKVAMAIEGSRHFRPPSGLGSMRYEGCEIAFLSGESALEAHSLMKIIAPLAVSTQEIEGVRVATFREQREEDEWTTFVAFPNDDIVLVASNLEYLRTVISRMRDATGQRALPASLPEWKYVNTQAIVWGLRHYRKSEAALDPSSPYGGPKAANFPDAEAVGLTFEFEQTGAGKLTYLSTGKGAREALDHSLAQAGLAPGAAGLRVRELAPDSAELSFAQLKPEHFSQLLLVLSAMLGHGVYL